MFLCALDCTTNTGNVIGLFCNKRTRCMLVYPYSFGTSNSILGMMNVLKLGHKHHICYFRKAGPL